MTNEPADEVLRPQLRILLATRNKDKSQMLRMVLGEIDADIKVHDVLSIALSARVRERGTIAERAAQKVRVYRQEMVRCGRSGEIDMILGVDDGLCVAERSLSTSSWDVTGRLLRGDWPVGTPVTVVRSFYLGGWTGWGERMQVSSRFTYVGGWIAGPRARDTYPLRGVLSPEGSEVSISQLTVEQQRQFYVRQLGRALTNLLHMGMFALGQSPSQGSKAEL